jgi:hypothetical protein
VIRSRFVDDGYAVVERPEKEKFNPYHEPAGSPGGIGGRFAHSPSHAAKVMGLARPEDADPEDSEHYHAELAEEIRTNRGRLRSLPREDQGVHKSYFYTAEDGTTWFVKEIITQDRREVTREIANREVAKVLGIEDHFPEVFDVSSGMRTMLAAEVVDGDPWWSIPRHLRQEMIDNADDYELTSLLAFDYITMQTDRHGGNIMVDRSGSMIFIDNGGASFREGMNTYYDGGKLGDRFVHYSRPISRGALENIVANRDAIVSILPSDMAPEDVGYRIDIIGTMLDETPGDLDYSDMQSMGGESPPSVLGRIRRAIGKGDVG